MNYQVLHDQVEIAKGEREIGGELRNNVKVQGLNYNIVVDNLIISSGTVR